MSQRELGHRLFDMRIRRPLTKLTLLLLCALALRTASAAEVPPLPPTLDIPAVLSLDDALRLFQAHGLDLLIADATVESARADVKVAGAVTNPILSGSFLKSFSYDPSDPSFCPPGGGCSDLGFTLGLSDQALWDVMSGKRGLRLATSRLALQSARLARKDAERNLSFQVKQQVVQVALAQRAVSFGTEVAQAATQTAELNRRRYQVGAISEVDLAKAETEQLQTLQTLDSARNNLRVQKVGLAFLLGARGPVPDFSVSFNLMEHPAPEEAPELGDTRREELIHTALASRPDLQAQRQQQRRAEAGLESAHRQLVPDVAFSLQYQQQGTGQTAIQPPTLSVGASLALPLWSQSQGPIAKAQADLSQQSAQLAKLQAQAVSDVETSWASLDLNRRLIARLETGLLERAKVTRDLQQLRYQKGAASLLEYLDAQRTFISSYQDYFQALASYWTARFQLEQAVGI